LLFVLHNLASAYHFTQTEPLTAMLGRHIDFEIFQNCGRGVGNVGYPALDFRDSTRLAMS